MIKTIYKFILIWSKIDILKLISRRPWTKKFYDKFSYIKKAIDSPEIMGKFKNSEFLPKKYGFNLDERAVEYPWVLSRIPQGGKGLLDAGSALNFREILDSPCLKNKEITIAGLVPEKECFSQANLFYVFGDMRNLSFENGYFDYIVCISTLEHIGMDNILYAKNAKYRENKPADFKEVIFEFKRVLKKGGSLYITVPFGKHQNHNWFQQFDSIRIGQILKSFSPEKIQISYYKYYKDGWNISNENDCRNAEYLMGISAQAVACLELVK